MNPGRSRVRVVAVRFVMLALGLFGCATSAPPVAAPAPTAPGSRARQWRLCRRKDARGAAGRALGAGFSGVRGEGGMQETVTVRNLVDHPVELAGHPGGGRGGPAVRPAGRAGAAGGHPRQAHHVGWPGLPPAGGDRGRASSGRRSASRWARIIRTARRWICRRWCWPATQPTPSHRCARSWMPWASPSTWGRRPGARGLGRAAGQRARAPSCSPGRDPRRWPSTRWRASPSTGRCPLAIGW